MANQNLDKVGKKHQLTLHEVLKGINLLLSTLKRYVLLDQLSEQDSNAAKVLYERSTETHNT